MQLKSSPHTSHTLKNASHSDSALSPCRPMLHSATANRGRSTALHWIQLGKRQHTEVYINSNITAHVIVMQSRHHGHLLWWGVFRNSQQCRGGCGMVQERQM